MFLPGMRVENWIPTELTGTVRAPIAYGFRARVAEHGGIGLGNPIGGLVFSSAFGTLMQLHEWTVRSPLFTYQSS